MLAGLTQILPRIVNVDPPDLETPVLQHEARVEWRPQLPGGWQLANWLYCLYSFVLMVEKPICAAPDDKHIDPFDK